jgi:Ca-activated chloride channel homolog
MSPHAPAVRVTAFSTSVLSLAVLLSALFAAGPALAGIVKLNDVGHGSLLLRDSAQSDPNAYVEAPLLETDIDVTVTGLVVRAQVRQRFKNPTPGFVEGTYVFPLSDTAAVDSLRVIVGSRIIEGRIEEKKKAAEIYEKAKREGKIASLVEQLRPNLFTTSVANIPAGEHVDVILGYQDTLPVAAGHVSMRLPLAVTPRYTPASNEPLLGGKPMAFTTEPGPVAIDVLVDAGFPVARVASSSHAIERTQDEERVFHVGLQGGRGRMDKDFVLEWDAKPMTAPTTSVLYEHFQGEQYGLLMISPPTIVSDSARVPTDTTFILDTSGSMAGASMDDAKRALALAIGKLPAGDRFNVIEFDDDTHPLFPSPRSASEDNKAHARRVIDGYAADGGTMMKEPLEMALKATDGSTGRLQQVIFITDGAVSDEAELFEIIKHHINKARLFTVAIGPAPNAYFMRKAAEMGRGTFTFIGKAEEVQQKMSELFDKLETPVLTNLELAFGDATAASVEVWPRKLPDLFVGEPLMVVFKTQSVPSSVQLMGMAAGTPVTMAVSMSTSKTAGDRGLHKLWARRKVDSLTDAKNTATLTADAARAEGEILATALMHGIVSDLTSLVAVDVTPVRKGEALAHLDVPTAMPAGMLPRGGTEGPMMLLLGLGLLALALVSRERMRDEAGA